MVDRYTKVVLTVIAISLLITTVRPLLAPRDAEAVLETDPNWKPPTAEELAAQKKALDRPTIPRAWGRLVAVEHHPTFQKRRTYYFESSDGAIRTLEASAVVEITRK